MDKRILILINDSHLDTNVTTPTDYTTIIDKWNKQGGGNSGNKLFVTAVSKYLYRHGVTAGTFNPQMTPDYINRAFDMVVYPTANIFGQHYKSGLLNYAEFFSKIDIPIFVIGAGIQCDSYKDLKKLKNAIGDETKAFVEKVYRTGGEFALRGNYTKEFLDSVVWNSAVVTGCPSIYQNGKNLCIIQKEKPIDDFRIAVNGSIKTINKTGLYRILDHSIYMDQDEFIHLMFDKNGASLSLLKLLWKYSYPGLKAYVNDKVQLLYDVPTWMEFIKNNVDFSIGTRIHGNIAAILQGVPAVVVSSDLRTRELAEFFKIPMLDSFRCKEIKDVYDLYNVLDFSEFNKNYRVNYSIFEKFMVEHGIVDSIEITNEWDKIISRSLWSYPSALQDNRNMVKEKLNKAPSFIKCIFEGKRYYAFKTMKRRYKVTYTNMRR